MTTTETLRLEAQADQLALLRGNLQTFPYPGYPELHDRLVLYPDLLEKTDDDRLILPDGPWEVNTHDNQMNEPAEPTLYQQKALRELGHELDSRGRPLHPWLYGMITDPAIGVVTGKGAFWNWGPNYTVDPIVMHAGHILVINRRDTGARALPGGFIDGDETADQAGKREVAEETDIIIPETATPIQLYQGPVSDVRTTAHAWPETTALLYVLSDDEILASPRGLDDAEAADWIPISDILKSRAEFFGSHDYLIRLALGRLAVQAL